MPTGYKLDADSVRMIDTVVRRVLASEPTTRGRQRRGGGSVDRVAGELLITLQDISAAEIIHWDELDGVKQRAFHISPDPEPKQKVWSLSRGEVQVVKFSQDEWGGRIVGTDPDDDPTEFGPWITGDLEPNGDPKTMVAYNMVPETIHAGKLCQGKRIQLYGVEYLFIDVEPCD